MDINRDKRSHLIRSTAGIIDLDIAGQVAVSVYLGELRERLVRNLTDVELVVTYGKDIVVNVFKYGIGDLSVDSIR